MTVELQCLCIFLNNGDIIFEQYDLFQSLSITAALLPSLQAQYKMEHVHSSGVTGTKAHFTVDLPQHSLSFVTKLQVCYYF